MRLKCIGYALKADIRHYFDTVDHGILLTILERKIKDPDIIWLIKLILNNYAVEIVGKGMPLGNLTSQFFANVYLNELDQHIKNNMKVKYYIRYVDDFVIFHKDRCILENWKVEIDKFLKSNLKVELHPEKSRIISLNEGITLLGYRVFPNNRLIKRSNSRRIWKRLRVFKSRYDEGKMSRFEIANRIGGWISYAEFANSYKIRKRVFIKCKDIIMP